MWSTVCIALVLAVSALGQDFATECPSPNGYFADSVQCDKYYECIDDVLTEKLCPDGMSFNDLNPRVEKCDFNFQIDCTGRPELQPAQPTEACPRQNGYYPVADETNCSQFHYCAAGVGNLITCPESLAFSLKTGTCVWPEAAGRKNCVSEQVLNFTCPTPSLDSREAHPRYSDPDDCQYFYVCINGKTPRRNGCSFGQVFNSLTTACGSPKEVPECVDYYKEYFENYFTTLGDDTGRVSGDIIAAAIASGFQVPQFTDRQRIHSPSTQRRGTTRAPPLDAGDSPSLGPTRGPSRVRGSSTAGGDTPVRPSTSIRNRPSRFRPATSGTEGGRRRTRPTALTTTTTPPPPPPADDYVYYDDTVYYDDVAGDVAADPASADTTDPTPAPPAATEASDRRVPFRRTLVNPRS